MGYPDFVGSHATRHFEVITDNHIRMPITHYVKHVRERVPGSFACEDLAKHIVCAIRQGKRLQVVAAVLKFLNRFIDPCMETDETFGLNGRAKTGGCSEGDFVTCGFQRLSKGYEGVPVAEGRLAGEKDAHGDSLWDMWQR